MGSLTITIPQKIRKSFKVKDLKFAKQLVADLESYGEPTSAFDEVFGIWAGREESEKDLVKRIRDKNNTRNG